MATTQTKEPCCGPDCCSGAADVTEKPHERDMKEVVREKYGAIAERSGKKGACGCCGTGDSDFSVMAEDYTSLPGYAAGADLKLGCGIPTEYARISPGDTVVDLGSGAGNDCFVARALVGDTGRVIGVDMTEAMLAKANRNVKALGFTNVEFHLGDIERLPLEDGIADVVVSNCVMNLVPDKRKAFAETYRILKRGGHFSISDIVLVGDLPEALRTEASLYAGCVAGAVSMEEYLGIIREAGFTDVQVQKKRLIELPRGILERYLAPDKLAEFTKQTIGIFSISVYAEKK